MLKKLKNRAKAGLQEKCFIWVCACVGSYHEDKGFAKKNKAHFNPVEASLLFNTFNNNNSKLTPHTKLFLVTVTSMKGNSLGIDGAGGVNLINSRERERERGM